MFYYLSWSPTVGEATYTHCFDSEEERNYFIRNRLDSRVSYRTWEFDPAQ